MKLTSNDGIISSPSKETLTFFASDSLIPALSKAIAFASDSLIKSGFGLETVLFFFSNVTSLSFSMIEPVFAFIS